MDGVFQTMEGIDGWLYGYSGSSGCVVRTGKSSGAKGGVSCNGEGIGSIFLEVDLITCMRASVGMIDWANGVSRGDAVA